MDIADKTFLIDAETRVINIPDGEGNLGVEGDVGTGHKYFKCPRIVGDDGIDLNEHQIYISYVKTNTAKATKFVGDPALYHCNDVALDETGDYVTFSWEMTGDVFKTQGLIAFKVMAKKTDGESVKTCWNTRPAIGTVCMTVPDGIEGIAELYPDIITQLLDRMDAVEDIATEEAMQRYVEKYLGEHPVQLDSTLTDPEKAAPADVVGGLKSDLLGLKSMLNIHEQYLLKDKFINGHYYAWALPEPVKTSNAGYRCYSEPILLKKGVTYNFSKLDGDFSWIYTTTGKSKAHLKDVIDAKGNYTPDDNYLFYATTSSGIEDSMIVDDNKTPKKYVEGKYIEGELVNYVTVAKDGSGDFTSIIDAYNSITDSSEYKKYTIYVKQGVYDEFNRLSTSGTDYIGICLTKPYVSFEGEDAQNTFLVVDGSTLFAKENLTSDEAKRVSIFHWMWNVPYKGFIKNFTFQVVNARYCIHPETASKGYLGDWLVENCIFNWGGNHKVSGFVGGAVGIGISKGEKGHFKNCKWLNSDCESVLGHNNYFDYEDVTPIVKPNAVLIFENCDFGGGSVHVDDVDKNDSGIKDCLKLINCTGISRGYFGNQGGANKWVCVKENTRITNDEFRYD